MKIVDIFPLDIIFFYPKFFGVIIDHKLNWSDHILCIKNKISKSIGIINKIRNRLDRNTLRNLYFTFIYPYLIYCIEIWGNTNDTHLNPIVKIKKVYGQYHLHITLMERHHYSKD